MISAGHHIEVLNILIRSIMSNHGDDKICCSAPEGSFSQTLIYILQASDAAHSAKRLQRGGMPKPLQAKLPAFYYR